MIVRRGGLSPPGEGGMSDYSAFCHFLLPAVCGPEGGGEWGGAKDALPVLESVESERTRTSSSVIWASPSEADWEGRDLKIE